MREVGRQPWVIYGLVRTAHSASPVPLAAVQASLLLFVAFYAVLAVLFLVFARALLVRGPDFPKPDVNPRRLQRDARQAE